MPSARACIAVGEAQLRAWGRRRSLVLALPAALVLAALGVWQIASHGARAVASANVAPTPQPALGTADASTVLMGAAISGTPGEAWAYRVLPLDVPLASGSEDVVFAPAAKTNPPGQLVFERATDADPDWTIAETPLNEEGQPYRGMEPNRTSARITAHGGGLLVGQDSTRPLGKQTVVLARNPEGRFRVLPEPSRRRAARCGRSGRAGRKRRHQRGGARRKGRHRAPSPTRLSKTKATPKPTLARSGVRAILVLRAGTAKNGRASRLNFQPATRAASRSLRSPAPRPRTCGCSARRNPAAGWGFCCSSAQKRNRRIPLGSGLARLRAVRGRGNTGRRPLQARPAHGLRAAADGHRKRRVDRRQPAGARRRRRRV